MAAGMLCGVGFWKQMTCRSDIAGGSRVMWRIEIIGGFYHAATQGYEAFGGEVGL